MREGGGGGARWCFPVCAQARDMDMGFFMGSGGWYGWGGAGIDALFSHNARRRHNGVRRG